MSDRTETTLAPSDEVDVHHKYELQRLASRYSIGSPLTRVRTRTDSSDCLWEHLRLATTPPRVSSPAEVLYKDEFVTLTASSLVVSHLLFRRQVTIPLPRVHTARAFCSPAQLVKLVAASRQPRPPSPSPARGPAGAPQSSAQAQPPQAPRGVVVGGLGSTGVFWARDPARVSGERWKENAVVIDAEGWIGRIGFTVEDADAWWKAWATATGTGLQAHF